MTSLFEMPAFKGWVTDPVVRAHLDWPAELDAMLAFEFALADVQERYGLLPTGAATDLRAALGIFQPDMDALAARTRLDGLPVPELVAQMRKVLGKQGHLLHKGATSQDVIDTALMLRMGRILDHLTDGLTRISDRLDDLSARFGQKPLMAVTRLRAALPVTVDHRLNQWRAGIETAGASLNQSRQSGLPIQLGGPVGADEDMDRIRADLAVALGLHDPGRAWHTTRAPITALAQTLQSVTTATGKIGADLGLMSQDGVRTADIPGGGSSAMAHKVNPVDAELLVSLARYASVLTSGIAQASVQEYERSGAGWTLEWLCFPQLVMTTGGAVMTCDRLLGTITDLGDPLP